MNHIYLAALGLIVMSGHAWAWGTRGHELIVETGNALVTANLFENCHVTSNQLIEHVSDPDIKWKQDRRRHPDEQFAHFFHVDTQPKNWRERKEAADVSQGFLVYRILKWTEDAKGLRKAQKWAELQERLYGLGHYIGDLSMPLHLTKLHDGKEVGLPDLHKQWESTMVKRYYDELEKMVRKQIKWERVPPLWSRIELSALIFNIAEQSYSKSSRLFDLSKEALEFPRGGRHGRRRNVAPVPRFTKPKLFEATGEFAATQLALSSRLWAHVFSQVCQ